MAISSTGELLDIFNHDIDFLGNSGCFVSQSKPNCNDFLPMIKMFSPVSFHSEGWTMECGILENNDISYGFKAQDAALKVDRKGGRAQDEDHKRGCNHHSCKNQNRIRKESLNRTVKIE